jgi:hypothetical protein
MLTITKRIITAVAIVIVAVMDENHGRNGPRRLMRKPRNPNKSLNHNYILPFLIANSESLSYHDIKALSEHQESGSRS